jgi:hypothetical protein
MSGNEIKGEQAVALTQSGFTMSPVPFLPFNDAGHCPLAYSVHLSMRSAFLIVRLHATLIIFSPVVSLNYKRRVALRDTNESQI